MIKLNLEGSAPKIKGGGGDIHYRLWLDTEGKLYVQLEGNDDAGTFSNLLFSVSKYESIRDSEAKIGELMGYNIDTKKFETRQDNNNGAFLKAVLRHIFPKKEK